MLIDSNIITKIINQYNIDVTGILHIGAHDCGELNLYQDVIGVSPNDIIWIDAIESIVIQSINRGIPNVYHALITDKDDDTVNFNLSNNEVSSSIFELGQAHMQNHPEVHYINTFPQKTVTVDTFFQRVGINPEKYVFWNFDIQGAELLALKGGVEAMKYAKILYLEVNESELYKNCARLNEIDAFLELHGFKREFITMWGNAGWGDAIYVRV